MESYFKCSLFKNKNFSLKDEFDFVQEEILHSEGNKFSKIEVQYKCKWDQKRDVDKSLPFAIIPIKDNLKLLEYTVSNFEKNNFLDFVNLIVVDDRSEEDIKSFCGDKNINYLRVDNEKGFNFSMLNNIASLVAHKLGGKQVIFWNSDLWIDKIEYFKTLLQRHNDNKSTISGSKLLYPFESLNDEDSVNISTHFPHMKNGRYKGTVQFGGSRWIPVSSEIFNPIHYKRFADKDHHTVNCDYGTHFVTGALQVIELEWFIKNGGYNPSLSKLLQDVDLCLRASEQNKKIMYFGKDIHFFHDESFNHFSNKNEVKMDKQYNSDGFLFAQIWKNKVAQIIL